MSPRERHLALVPTLSPERPPAAVDPPQPIDPLLVSILLLGLAPFAGLLLGLPARRGELVLAAVLAAVSGRLLAAPIAARLRLPTRQR